MLISPILLVVVVSRVLCGISENIEGLPPSPLASYCREPPRSSIDDENDGDEDDSRCR